MITFNLKAGNSNYLKTHAPSGSNCWGDEDEALVLTLDQAREIIEECKFYSHPQIVISRKSTPITDDDYHQELFCIKGVNWFYFNKGL